MTARDSASAGSVIRYDGKRGAVWRIKFRDATYRQVMETLGREADGWNRNRAERALGARLAEVEQSRWRKPEKLAFAAFAERFQTEVLPGRNLKPSTLLDYETMLRLHLVPAFEGIELSAIEAADLDHSMFKIAKRWRLVAYNPVEEVDRPRSNQAEMSVLTEPEIARLLNAYRELEAAPLDKTNAGEWRQARRIVTVALGSGLRRGELLALRWRDVQLLEGVISVREAFVRGAFQTPKTLAALNEQWQDTAYKTDSDLVFCHRQIGTPLDPSKLSREFLRPALKKAGIAKPFRVWHDLRHTAITHDAAAGNPQAYVQMKAGHSQGAITERYIHAAAVLFPGAADKAEQRLFAQVTH
jgi:integrase